MFERWLVLQRIFERMRSLFLILLLAVSPVAGAGELVSLFAGGGVLNYQRNRLANAITGAPTTYAVLLPQVSLGADFGLPSLVPGGSVISQLTYTPFGRTSPDKGEKTTMLGLSARYKQSFYFADVKMGPGLFMYRVAGAGGSVTLDNGTSKSDFAVPAYSYSSWTGFWAFGIGGGLSWVRLDLDAWVHDFLSSQRRSTSVLASVSFFFL